MTMKGSITIERATLLKTISARNLSPKVLERTSEIIKNTREKLGQEASDRKAKALRIMIENSANEQEVLEKLKNQI